MEYEVKEALLWGLVKLLRPAKEDVLLRPEILDGTPQSLTLTTNPLHPYTTPNAVADSLQCGPRLREIGSSVPGRVKAMT